MQTSDIGIEAKISTLLFFFSPSPLSFLPRPLSVFFATCVLHMVENRLELGEQLVVVNVFLKKRLNQLPHILGNVLPPLPLLILPFPSLLFEVAEGSS